MTNEQYNAMLDEMDALPQPEAITDFKLSQKELDIIANLPDEVLNTIQEQLDSYKPQSELDIRSQLAFKAVARLFMYVPVMRKALGIGYKWGAEM